MIESGAPLTNNHSSVRTDSRRRLGVERVVRTDLGVVDRLEPTGEGVDRRLHRITFRRPTRRRVRWLAPARSHSGRGCDEHGRCECRRRCRSSPPAAGSPHRATATVPRWRPDLDDAHPVEGERPGLVGADERDRTQCFDRLQMTDQRMLPGHVLGPHGEREGHGRQAGPRARARPSRPPRRGSRRAPGCPRRGRWGRTRRRPRRRSRRWCARCGRAHPASGLLGGRTVFVSSAMPASRVRAPVAT